ncbi:hypothetical protein CRG98_018018 [Punica granatum]|uniref:Uncharacterized protein n=1 Tax=Punica granatum TaxID=22663 RepID=A0A2I0JZ23_PUNGR|nr:hypothetical protein CRG98_018018 [Punica granatum]
MKQKPRKYLRVSVRSRVQEQVLLKRKTRRLRELLRGCGEVYSLGTYITPKFGSYSTSLSKSRKDCNGGYLINSELVTAIEEHMQQLQVEEETILKHIVENWEDPVMEEDRVEEELVPEIEKREVDSDLVLENQQLAC